MKRVATPMFGGVVTFTVVNPIAYPAIYFLWRSRDLAVPGALIDDTRWAGGGIS
jgi:hypothetical protein